MLRSTLTLMYRMRVALLLGIVVCLSAGRAEACGEAFFKIAYANPTGSGGSMVPSHGHPVDRSLPGDRPCHGPNCSGVPAPTVPPISTAPVSEPTAKELARHCLNEAAACDSPSKQYVRDTNSPRPITGTSSIFHPP